MVPFLFVGCIIPAPKIGGIMKLRSLKYVFVAAFALVPVANAEDHWVATWATAPQQARVLPGPAVNATPAGGGGGQRGPQGAPAPAANPAPSAFNDQTVRMIVHTSIGGRRARVTLSNTFGNSPLTIAAAHVTIRSKDSAIVPGSDRALMFNGKPRITIAPG